MFDMKHKVPFAFAVLTLMLCGASVLTDASATGGDLTGYGNANEIEIAPGYSWSYTSTFPSDLEDGTVMSLEKNELGDIATLDKHTLRIGTIPSDKAGASYNIVLKAYHGDSGQTAYQWIRITVNDAMSVSCTGCINEIIKGSSQNIDLKSEGGIGTVTWTASEMAPGLTLDGNRISGVPTKVGANTIVLKATSSQGESKDLTIGFTVYNVIVGGTDESIVAIGGIPVSSTAVEQTGTDLGVSWVADRSLPAGLVLYGSTGTISGTYTGTTVGQTVVTLTGTSSHGPEQTVTKKVTIDFEPAFTLADVGTVVTYTGNAKTVSSIAMVPSTSEHSSITYSLKTAIPGVSVDASTGSVTVSGSAAVTGSGSATVVARSANGQVVEKTVSYIVEDTLSVTGPAKLVAKQSKAASEGYTISGGSSNAVAIGANAYGDALTFADGRLSITYPEPHASETITLKVTSAGGQAATISVDVIVYSTLGFDSSPSAAGMFAYAE